MRAIAALCVIPGHVEQLREAAGLGSWYWFPIPGKLGVVLFFSLSGFLITTLLLEERASTGTIDAACFYKRRVLRIWPLYFLLMALSILVINRIPFLQIPALSGAVYSALDARQLLLILFVLPNYLSFNIPYASQTWSIGIEEQFYAVQPLIVRLSKSVTVATVLIACLVGLKEVLAFATLLFPTALLSLVEQQCVYYGCVGVGCLGAILCFARPRALAWIFAPATQIAAAAIAVACLWAVHVSGREDVVDFRVYALVFTIAIINAARNPGSPYNLRCKPLAYLGRISYGLYMYHPLCIGIAIAAARPVMGHLPAGACHVGIYVLAVALTIGLSAVSFAYIEGYFLRLKDRIRFRA